MDVEKAIELAQQGRQRGFSWLFQAYRLPIHRWLRRRLESSAEFPRVILLPDRHRARGAARRALAPSQPHGEAYAWRDLPTSLAIALSPGQSTTVELSYQPTNSPESPHELDFTVR